MMTKKAQVVMLPTETKSTIQKFGTSLRLQGNHVHPSLGYYQHLYFTTDDEIKDGDWIWYKNASTKMEAVMNVTKQVADVLAVIAHENKRKIVATTDSKLKDKAGYYDRPSVPDIPKDFIEAYVREQGRIKEVLLEYDYLKHPLDPSYTEDNCYGLKLRPNGSVIIHPVKPVTYSAEEFRKAVQMAFNDGANWAYNAKIYTSLTSGDPIPSEDYFNKHYNNQ